jgi:signal transduction histidine kinase
MPVHLVPHSVCWAAAPALIWTMVVTNFITFASYTAICFIMFRMLRRTRAAVARDWRYFVVGFALFIVACGSTHLLEVITTWSPIFWVDAWTNIITAVLSAWVAFMLARRAGVISFSINDYAQRLGNTEQENRQMQERLLAAQKLEDWSRMSATISHEIRNPLEAIQNLQYLIRTTNGISPEVKQLAEQTTAETKRVLEISESSLSFIRQASVPEQVNLPAVAESLTFLLGDAIRERAIDLRIDSSGDCTVETFAGEARQVLLNIVRNACEASLRKGTQVRVTIRGGANEVNVTVHDQGAGVSPQVLSRLFEFGVTTKGADGNGMGLWTVKRLMERAGGGIRVDSEPGSGTTVSLWWPHVFQGIPSEALAVS